MNLVCIDIGNTNVVIGYYHKNQLIEIKRIETTQFKINELNLLSNKNIAISSVVPKITQLFTTYNPFFIDYLNSNLTLDVDNPNEVGNDRLCNIKAVIKNYALPAIIIDFGSATTYDIIDNNGVFIGGVIAPGIEVSAQHLFQRAALLNNVDFLFPKSVIGKNTITNLQSGIMFGGIDAINGMINRIKEEFNDKIKTIILTGGFAEVLSSQIKETHVLDKNLTLKGIKTIWIENS